MMPQLSHGNSSTLLSAATSRTKLARTNHRPCISMIPNAAGFAWPERHSCIDILSPLVSHALSLVWVLLNDHCGPLGPASVSPAKENPACIAPAVLLCGVGLGVAAR